MVAETGGVNNGLDRRVPSPWGGRRRLLRILGLLIVAALVFAFWRDVLFGLLVYLVYTFMFLNYPVGAFASLGAIVFAIGWCLCPWPGRTRRRRWQPAVAVLAVVAILHAGWFVYGWVTFYPT